MLIGLATFGALATACLVMVAARRLWLPNPVTARSAHKTPVSRAGGVVVLGVTCGLALIASALGEAVDGLLLALMVVGGALGLADDRRDLGARMKLGALAALAGAAALTAGPVPNLAGLSVPTGLGVLLAWFWVLGFANVFNFMDGLNGVAAGTGLVLLGALAASGINAGEGGAALPLLAGGALLGFAVLNVARGAPFLGDAGSLSIGVLIAAGALRAGEAFWVVAAGSVPFVADAGLTLLDRARRGADVLSAHDEHVYQRLAKAGWPHAAVAALYMGLAALGVVAAGPALALGAVPYLAVVAGLAATWWGVTRAALRRRALQARR